jgi:hypothetical protein
MNRARTGSWRARIAERALAQSLAILMAHVRSWQRQACLNPRGQDRLPILVVADVIVGKGCGLLLNPDGIGLGRYRLVAPDI